MRVLITVAAAALFLLLRPDIVGLLQGKLRAEVRLRASPRIDQYIRNNPVRKLQIGAGENSKPGWLNTDIEPLAGQAYLDAGRPFPLPDRSSAISKNFTMPRLTTKPSKTWRNA